jgi:hypothetical protein
MMSYGDDISRYPSMKGISVDLPFIKFRYVKLDRNETEESKPLKITDNSVKSEDVSSLNSRRIVYTREAEVTTMGLDPMVSKASVIHELVYGRTESASTFTRPLSYPAMSYPAEKEASSHSLDIVV